ncbi:hypothetical protein DINM_000051 [Dirofilaria immitis]|nr:hypothetical protein [Dirofilaria immitis]
MAQLGPKKVIVTASYVQRNPPLLKLFRNYTLPVSEAENKALGYDSPCENLIWKCARYSSAAPTFFTPKDNFVDGGLMSNNPTLDLMADIHTYNAACIKAVKKETIHVGCILSLGTGQAPPKDLGSIRWNFGLPGGLAEGHLLVLEHSKNNGLRRVIDIHIRRMSSRRSCNIITASNGSCVTRARCWAHDQSIPFFRFSPSLSSHVELDEKNNDIIVNFLWETEKYLRTDGKHNVETLVKYLKSL